METAVKHCEVCGVEIPSDFQNLLCMECYVKQANKDSVFVEPVQGSGITDPEYREREEVEELDLVSRCHGRFKDAGLVMPAPQRKAYEAVKDYMRNECITKHVQYPKFIWKPTVIDIGSGLGIGSNILSQEADYVLGVDKNAENVSYASQMFTRQKNNVYWAPQVDFMVSDVYTDTREFMKFDFVTAFEIIEHLKDWEKLCVFIKKVVKPTAVIFISSPNRNAWKGTEREKTPLNEHHVREWSANEFKDCMSKYFSSVELLDYELNPVGDVTQVTPVVIRCRP